MCKVGFGNVLGYMLTKTEREETIPVRHLFSHGDTLQPHMCYLTAAALKPSIFRGVNVPGFEQASTLPGFMT